MTDYVYKHFQMLSDEVLERERTSGNLVPEAQKIADDEYLRRQTEPPVTEKRPTNVVKKMITDIKWWHWILIIIVIRAIFKSIKEYVG